MIEGKDDMRALIATRRTNGQAPGDYGYCIPGELVWLTMVCGDDERSPAGGSCGCGRGFGGLISHRATTTVEVAEIDHTPEEFELAVRTSLADQGWLRLARDEREERAMVAEAVGLVRDLAEYFPLGAVLRRRVHQVYDASPGP